MPTLSFYVRKLTARKTPHRCALHSLTYFGVESKVRTEDKVPEKKARWIIDRLSFPSGGRLGCRRLQRLSELLALHHTVCTVVTVVAPHALILEFGPL